MTVETTVTLGGSFDSNVPVIIDVFSQEYYIFQILLEQTIGSRLSRLHPIAPVGGLIDTNVFKKYSTGIYIYKYFK
jgi:hypothetical protein